MDCFIGIAKKLGLAFVKDKLLVTSSKTGNAGPGIGQSFPATRGEKTENRTSSD
jgi:hypothetical protein